MQNKKKHKDPWQIALDNVAGQIAAEEAKTAGIVEGIISGRRFEAQHGGSPGFIAQLEVARNEVKKGRPAGFQNPVAIDRVKSLMGGAQFKRVVDADKDAVAKFMTTMVAGQSEEFDVRNADIDPNSFNKPTRKLKITKLTEPVWDKNTMKFMTGAKL
jgi:hypothetical protein